MHGSPAHNPFPEELLNEPLTQPEGRKLAPGAVVLARELETLAGQRVRIPDANRRVHLQFRRFAGCPVCNLHLHTFVRRHDALERAGIQEVVVFHSTAEDLQPHAGRLPFAVIADPDKWLYTEFGAESAPRALLDPRAWWPILRAVFHSLVSIIRDGSPVPPTNPRGGRFGLPADFLIASDGRVLACKYGQHVDDQWSVDEVLKLAESTARETR
ncbi:AhpC/TSA family protein [Pyxidicoccus parkwayensis]|uniref:AhpC/TSA family protein n=1 Tax=Pyxidicoccus parkwayensis TaxID=2813578 RepID=A0ABX7NR10_9BACT|nr:peroxiredoxin-like family protein [Pyxidicoccus parkwaysis]QSQ20784.1 AhpC/TSA family protein [Pyxidicoccus parkwaysis]